MMTEFEKLTKEWLHVLPRTSLEELAWQEKEIISALREELLAASEQNEDLKGRAERLEEIIERFKKLLFAKRSERSPRKVQSGKPNPEPKDSLASHIKKPSERYPNVMVVDVEVLPQEPLACSSCGAGLKDSGLREVSEQLTVIPRKFLIERIHKPKFHCACCHLGLETFSPPRIRPGSAFSDEMIIDVAAAKYGDLVPIERYCEIARANGLEGLLPQTLIDLTHHLAEFLSGVVECILQGILTSPILLADETPHRMLEGDEKSNWYLWGFCDGKNSYFEIHDTRSGDVAAELLAKARCHTLVSDVFTGYDRAVRIANEKRPPDSPVAHAYCNAHARRRFVEAQGSYPKEAEFYLASYADIYRLEAEARHLPSLDRAAARQGMEAIFLAMRAHAVADLAAVSAKSSLARAIRYFDENFEGLTHGLRHADAPLDNNLQERQLRRPVIGRKTWYGTHSKKGAQTAAALFTISQSCRLCKVDVREFMRAVVRSLHNNGPPFSPWEYSQIAGPAAR